MSEIRDKVKHALLLAWLALDVGYTAGRRHAAQMRERLHTHLRAKTARHAGHPDAPAVDAETGVVNVNRHRHETMSLNEQIAVYLTDRVGTMQTAYVFAGIGVGSLVGALTDNALLAATFGALSSYFLQLVLLPILAVGQNVNARHSEARPAADFEVNRRTLKKLMDLQRVNAEQLALIRALVERLDRATSPAPAAAPVNIPEA